MAKFVTVSDYEIINAEQLASLCCEKEYPIERHLSKEDK